ncbi:MAG: TIGR01777 family oxidoreductase [Desulfurivibrio sp.]|nr:TIGR01777 family oxidoreductase [Desulfurivibrio sp.]
MKKIFIVGATGFVGQALAAHLLNEGHQVSALARSARRGATLPAGVEVITGDPTQAGPWQQQAAAAEVVINLAGASIFTRWNERNKRLILDSRVLTTRHLVAALAECKQPPTLINTSAAGYYGFGQDAKNEQAPPGDDFLARVCVAWEREAQAAASYGARVVITRLAVVLGDNGGALGRMLPAFRLGLGGRLGDGRQPFPWIHIADLLAIYSFIINNQDIVGPVNCGVPDPPTNAELTKALGRALGRPTILPVPAPLLRLAMGEASAMLLQGTRMVPEVLPSRGFKFRFSDLDQALANLL